MDFENEILRKLSDKTDKETSKKILFEEVFGYLNNELEKIYVNVDKISDFLLKLKIILEEKNMAEEFEITENVYFLDEKYMLKLVNSTNSSFLFLLRKFYSNSPFLEFYLIVLEKMENIIVKSNLLVLLGKEFIDLGFQIENYIQYLKDNDEYLELYGENILEYNIFREVLQPFIKDIINQDDRRKLMKLLNFFENMAQSPDKYIKILLIDMIIETGWLEDKNSFESYIENFGDHFLELYAGVYDGRIFFKNNSIWKEAEKRNLKVYE